MSKRQKRREARNKFQKSEIDKRADAKNPEVKKDATPEAQRIYGSDPGVFADAYLFSFGTIKVKQRPTEKPAPPPVAVQEDKGGPKTYAEMEHRAKPASQQEKESNAAYYGRRSVEDSYMGRLFGYSTFVGESSTWVKEKSGPKDLLSECLSRPHSHFPEIDDINRSGARGCRCDDCVYQRRRLIDELRQAACENR